MSGRDRLYAYAVRRAEDAAAPEGVAGLGGAELFHVAAGGLAVLVSRHDGGEIRRARRNVLAHLKAVEAAMADGPVLPMRFGVAGAADGIAQAVAAREEELAALLDRHDGLAEFGLRIAFPREAALAALTAARPDLARERARLAKAGAGARDALIALGQKVSDALAERRRAAEKRLLAVLRPRAEDTVLRAPDSDVEALRAEFLLARDGGEAFAEAAAEAAAALDFAGGAAPEVRLVGPEPAYNFVSIHLDAPAEAA